MFSLEYPFPWSEDSFLPQELDVLGQEFDITLIPFKANLSLGQQGLPRNVRLDVRFSQVWDQKYKFWTETVSTFLSTTLWQSLWNHRARIRNVLILKAIIGELRTALRFAKWLDDSYARDLTDGGLILYSWWSNWSAIASCLVNKNRCNEVVVRGHGQDLYDSRTSIGFHPFQEFVVERCSRFLPDSEAGVDYLKRKYPASRCKIQVGRVGTRAPESLCQSSGDGIFRILTVSSLFPVKRIDLMALALTEVLTKYPSIKFLWKHIGDGPERLHVESILKRCKELQDRVRLTGHLDHSQVIAEYAMGPIDLVANVSSSEGVPVSLMEAASMGVPIMATNVGGNLEIVRATNGTLLSSDPTLEEIADAIAGLARMPEIQVVERRNSARKGWEQEFSSITNYQRLKDILLALC
jgi:colanic acid/amylovoran biosynthesis glycosyltransferase